ncbi:MAG: penicillin-binding protein activator [Syntrophaceae bacterium]|nr:penicillin-binding protein activator [Syntrophaceae bacterium]
MTLCLLLFSHVHLFAQAQPEDTLLFREGEIFLSKGESEKALWRFKKLVTEFPKSPLANDAKFRMGICYTQLRKPNEAISTLTELLSTFLSPSRMVQIFTLLGDNHLQLKDPFGALHWYGKGLLIPGQPREELRKKVRSVIDTFKTEEELTRVESLYRGAYGGGYAKLKLAQWMKSRGNDSQAKSILTEWEKEYKTRDYEPEAREVYESLHLTFKPKHPIGVILPLSGDYQHFGERALQGIQFAIKEAESGIKAPVLSLLIRDSKGDPSEAEKAVEDLVTKEGVLGIIGPLLSITAEKAAKKARQLQVPLLTLSQKELVEGLGDFVFQNSITPSEQVRALVAYAVKELGLQTFAVFYPNSPYGQHFKGLFAQELARMGGRLLATVAYHEGQTDFSREIRSFFKVTPIKKETSKRTLGEEFEVGLLVDGLFIPDTHDRVGLILSQLAYFDVTGPVFLGTNAWNGPELIRIAGKSAEGAIFVDAFYKGASSSRVSRFVKGFQKAYQRDPETLEALGYDGAKILLEILTSKSVSSPIQMREELRRIQNFQGVSGLKGFGEDGKTIRTLSILQVKKGKIEQVAP